MGTDEDHAQAAGNDDLALAMVELEQATYGRLPDGQRRIFRAAMDAFGEKGFHATTTRDIAARAGLSPAALYVHFGSKEEVLHRISVAAVRLTQQITDSAAATEGGPAQRLSATVRELSAWHARHSAAVRLVLHHLTDLTPAHRAEIDELLRSIHRRVRGLVAEGVQHGEFQVSDPSATALNLLSLCVDTARWYRPGYRRTPAQIGDDHAGSALRLVAARP
ncbi:TetR family transcriptional regulator [Nocardia sp. 2]|uniref:TetR family transcriptional regulator n=1 Tax=Nocardia acididurans TaxID=2802282 RepID=A0ABS1M161_9NOCA|nr:TetR/AcrR family transcriptional regulator [Nocardia acididurans]MBL1073800.1 TetR family transcriptional regulator [Nocardia acididurans]